MSKAIIKNRRIILYASIAFLTGIIIMLATAISAAALDSAESPYGYFTVNGKNYKDIARVQENNYVIASALIYTNEGYYYEAPTGYLGAMSRLFNDDGVLCQWTDWDYNDNPAIGMVATTSTYYVKDSYYSYGITRAYNGSGYSSYYTFQSPCVTVS